MTCALIYDEKRYKYGKDSSKCFTFRPSQRKLNRRAINPLCNLMLKTCTHHLPMARTMPKRRSEVVQTKDEEGSNVTVSRKNEFDPFFLGL